MMPDVKWKGYGGGTTGRCMERSAYVMGSGRKVDIGELSPHGTNY